MAKVTDMMAAVTDSEAVLKPDEEWINRVKGLLRAEMTRRGVTYEDLTEKLFELGVDDTSVNIRNKVARGGFSAAFFLQCLVAMGVKELRID